MKALTKNIFRMISIAAVTLSLSSCMDPMFYHIRQEVKLEKATIKGDVYSIIRYTDSDGEKIYISNGNINKKGINEDGHGKWKSVNKPAGYVVSLAANEDTLFAHTVTFDEDTSYGEMAIKERKIYYSKDEGTTWTELKFKNDQGVEFSLPVSRYLTAARVILMGTNAVKKDHRKAYVNVEGKLYDLNGDLTSPLAPNTVTTSVSDPHSCAYLNGVKFFTYYGACSDETADSEATKIYFTDSNKYNIKVTTSDQVSGTYLAQGGSGEVCGIAVFNNALLIATTSGATIKSLSGSLIEDYANITSTLSASFECRSAFVADPSKSYKETAAYAGITAKADVSNANFSHEGLWSYYPSRGKWNIE